MSSRAGSRSASIPGPHGSDMPCARIATGLWAIGSELRLIEAVQSALISTVTLCSASTTAIVASSAGGAQSGTCGSKWSALRPAEWMQGALFRSNADKLEAVGVPRSEIRIFLIEPTEIRGSKAAYLRQWQTWVSKLTYDAILAALRRKTI